MTRNHAQAFADLHKPGEPLLLPNAWDVASAVAIAGAGAVGVNIEDRRDGSGLYAPAEQAGRLAVARAAVRGIPFWINARTDVFLAGTAGSMTLSSGPPRTLRRARTACSCQAWSTRRRSPSWPRDRCRSR
jgi:2-methylisocitrate lyase-like PEP mutase family enzyme